MALPAARMARWASRFAAYAEGDAALYLTPVGGGLLVAFIHDEEATEPEFTEAGALDRVHLTVMVRTELPTASQWSWRGSAWTVKSCEADYMGGAAWPLRATLERHAQ